MLRILEALALEGIPPNAEREVIIEELKRAGIEIPAEDTVDRESFDQDLTVLASTDLTPRSHLVAFNARLLPQNNFDQQKSNLHFLI